jgi:Spy/CpxP family protein refolding chaperone
MTRSQQQAMMFLLGAVLVGGALGFMVDRAYGNDKRRSWAPRQRMYEDLALTEAQRTAMDSLLDEQNCQIGAVMKPVRPRLDSIKSAARQQMTQLLTPEQVSRLELRRAEMVRRDSVEKVRRDSIAATRKTSTTSCRN